MGKKLTVSPLTYEDAVKAAFAGDAAFHRWDVAREEIKRISKKSALFVEQVCTILQAYPKKGTLCVETYHNSIIQRVTNGYFSVVFNPITGQCFVEVREDNEPLKNYMSSGGDFSITDLEKLEKFCETAKFIGGMGDEH